jgi:serine/threonine-protein kinase
MHREMSEQADQLERFRQEARAVAKLSHPNVVAVIDAGEDGGHPYIVFEYIEGETLKQRIERLGALDVQEAVAYAIEVSAGLALAHDRQMVHRDVKPQNVLIDADGRAKLTDFGISRQLEQDGLTATGRVLGTTDYVAPEQAMGHGVDPRSDIYSLGVVLYEALVGDVPFHADSQVGVAMKHVNEELPDVQSRRPEISAAVALVVERATAKDPAARYQRIEEMIEDLQTALEVEAARAGQTTGEATSVLEAVPPPRRKLASRARLSWAALIALLLIAGGTLAAVALIGSGEVGGGGGGADAAGQDVEIASATDFDPEGDAEEHSEETNDAIDEDPATSAWSTETYTSGLDGAAKSGVGIYVEPAEPLAATAIEIRSAEGGWSTEIYAASSGPPDELSGWTLLGSADSVGRTAEIPLDAGEDFRYYLVWITDLPPSGLVQVSNLRLFE